jgi:hypothetical protein
MISYELKNPDPVQIPHPPQTRIQRNRHGISQNFLADLFGVKSENQASACQGPRESGLKFNPSFRKNLNRIGF